MEPHWNCAEPDCALVQLFDFHAGAAAALALLHPVMMVRVVLDCVWGAWRLCSCLLHLSQG